MLSYKKLHYNYYNLREGTKEALSLNKKSQNCAPGQCGLPSLITKPLIFLISRFPRRSQQQKILPILQPQRPAQVVPTAIEIPHRIRHLHEGRGPALHSQRVERGRAPEIEHLAPELFGVEEVVLGVRSAGVGGERGILVESAPVMDLMVVGGLLTITNTIG